MNNLKLNIVVLSCSARLNYGNDFINLGCQFLLKDCFPFANIEYFEVLDSAIDNSLVISNYLWDYINSFDYVIIISGSLISERAKNIFKVLHKQIIKPKTILLGIGCFLYNQDEKMLCNDIEKWFDYIIVRDQITYSYFYNFNCNVFQGIDLAFFATECVKKITHKDPYMIINIEPLKLNLRTLSAYSNSFKKKYKDIYNVENTSYRYKPQEFSPFNFLYKKYLYYTIPVNLYRLYQNADYVITTRLHTLLVCLSNQVLVKYVGEDNGGSSGRLHLFNRFVKIENDKEYYLEDLSPIEKEKENLKELLKKVIV